MSDSPQLLVRPLLFMELRCTLCSLFAGCWQRAGTCQQPVERRQLCCQWKVFTGPDVSPVLLSSCSFWDICELSGEKGFPELSCFPPYSGQIRIYLKVIHQSVHQPHMSHQQREKKKKWKCLKEKTQPRKKLFLSRPVATIAMSHRRISYDISTYDVMISPWQCLLWVSEWVSVCSVHDQSVREAHTSSCVGRSVCVLSLLQRFGSMCIVSVCTLHLIRHAPPLSHLCNARVPPCEIKFRTYYFLFSHLTLVEFSGQILLLDPRHPLLCYDIGSRHVFYWFWRLSLSLSRSLPPSAARKWAKTKKKIKVSFHECTREGGLRNAAGARAWKSLVADLVISALISAHCAACVWRCVNRAGRI